MRRVPLLSGSRIVVCPVGDDDVVLHPPPPPAHLVDASAAVRDALRFPLSGPPLAELVSPRARATIVVDPRELPLPGVPLDPRQDALAAVLEELEEAGVSDERQTILVAGGLGRRLGQDELEQLLPRPEARAYRGRVLVHDASSPNLVAIAARDGTARVDRSLVETDLVVVVSGAESVIHGGPAALVSSCDAETIRSAGAGDSLLRLAGTPAWALALAVEAALGARVPLFGISLVLDHPRLTGRFRGYPHDPASHEHVIRSPFRRLYSLLPGGARRRVLREQPRRIGVTAAFGGQPSVAHAEALLRGIELRGTVVPEPLDALVVGVPWAGLHMPREPLNPITSAAMALGLGLRLWRDAFPLRADGTVVLVHSLTRSFAHVSQDPYRTLFAAMGSASTDAIVQSELAASEDERALAAYRDGRSCHPRLPFADWSGCRSALARVGRVVVAGSRDATAARTLGFVPSHSLSSALDMAHGVAGGRARVGILLAPPYPPLLVGG